VNGPRRYLLDANMILRLLVGEPPAQAAGARRLFARAEAGEVILELIPVVLAEVFYTLLSFYKVSRVEAAEMLTLLVQQRGLRLGEGELIRDALVRLQTTNVAFVDAFLAATSHRDALPVASFDRDLDKFKDITRHEPTA
jgi:predicted nucleic acid-binding protein